MKDVAAVAGVSPKTVSNVLTGAAGVRPATRQRVEAAIAELDFVPNLSARGLRSGRAGVIGVALPDLSTAFSASLSQTVVRQAHSRGIAVQIEETAADPRREFDLVSRARAHHIDGLILNPVSLEDSVVEHVEHLPPVVLIGEVEQHRVDRVFIDSETASYQMTEHLISRGARRIAVIGASGSSRGRHATPTLRYQGHHAALKAAQLSPDPRLEVGDVPWTMAGGARGMQRILAAGETFDAVAAFTDSLAMGALHVLSQRGIRVPEDVLVTGFDDVEHAQFTNPPLTTISFDHADYVTAAFDLLSSRLDDRSLPPRAVCIPHQVVTRGSTGATPTGWSACGCGA